MKVLQQSMLFGSFMILMKLLLLYMTDGDKVVVGKVTLPVYLYAIRSHLFVMLDFDTKVEGSDKEHSFCKRGVAIISSNLG